MLHLDMINRSLQWIRGLTDRDGAFKDLQTDFAPLCHGIKVDSSIYKRLSKISSSGPESIGPNCDGTRRLISFEEC